MIALRDFLRRPSTVASGGVALALYGPLAASTGGWLDPAVLVLAAVTFGLSARWARFVNRTEERILLRRPFVTLGRIGRFLVHLPVVASTIAIVDAAWPVTAGDLRSIGGPVGAILLILAAGQGWQVLGIRLANRGIGYKHRNVLVALGATAALVGSSMRSNTPSTVLFVVLASLGLCLAAADLVLGLLSDVRSLTGPKGDIGIFFGTFNPFHRTHIEMIERALRTRGLDRVLVHPTVIPRLHAQALARHEIEIVGYEAGMRVYGRTLKADANVDYFPTGSRFYDHRTRVLLIELSLRDARLEDRVEVLSWGDVYAERGFYGVVSEIKRRYPGRRLHGLHGSDAGGMWNRAIYDESGWIYPIAERRVDDVSGTAIRAGAVGMMTPTAEAVVDELRRGSAAFSVGGQAFAVTEGVVRAEPS
ncbi:MAG: hypothetical protein M3540_07480 [Actinomycetota bacterium]|nr:hypothetical protein [Actinomycetota bacterium]